MPITISQAAADKILEISGEEARQGQALRLGVVGGGCAGFNYEFFFEETGASEMDESFEDRGITFVVDCLSFQYLDGTDIDYVEGLYASGFKFHNPNVSSTCGCGQSFSV